MSWPILFLDERSAPIDRGGNLHIPDFVYKITFVPKFKRVKNKNTNLTYTYTRLDNEQDWSVKDRGGENIPSIYFDSYRNGYRYRPIRTDEYVKIEMEELLNKNTHDILIEHMFQE